MSATAIFIVGIIASVLFAIGAVLLIFAEIQPPNSAKYKTFTKTRHSLYGKKPSDETSSTRQKN